MERRYPPGYAKSRNLRCVCRALTSTLDAAIGLLESENDFNTIDNILRLLGEVQGDRNADVLLAFASKGDDFQRLCAVESLCKLGDIRVEAVAQALLGESRSPVRRDKDGWSSMSHVKSIRQLVLESLRSSPNPKLRQLGTSVRWPGWLTFWMC